MGHRPLSCKKVQALKDMLNQERVSEAEFNSAAFIGVFTRKAAKGFSRHPLRRLPDGRVIDLLGGVVNIDDFDLLAECDI